MKIHSHVIPCLLYTFFKNAAIHRKATPTHNDSQLYIVFHGHNVVENMIVQSLK